MRRKIFVGAHAKRERKAFKEFLIKYLKDKVRNIYDKIAEMIFEDENNVRTSKILQKIFVEVYEFYIKGDEKLESALVKELKIVYNKKDMNPSDVLSKLVSYLKNQREIVEEENYEEY
jgi:hypothetical protein